MTSLRTVLQSSATAVRLRPALVLEHTTLCVPEFRFGTGFVELKWDGDTYAGFRVLEFNGIAEIGTRKSKAALKDIPKSSIAAKATSIDAVL